MNSIAILPARSGSKRIKNKNIINFCGKPIIAYALEAVSKAQLFDKIHVSTDSDEIKNIVEFFGLSYRIHAFMIRFAREEMRVPMNARFINIYHPGQARKQ